MTYCFEFHVHNTKGEEDRLEIESYVGSPSKYFIGKTEQYGKRQRGIRRFSDLSVTVT